MTRTRIFSICAPWPWRYHLWSRSWHTFRSMTTIVWILSRSNLAEELWPGHGFAVYVHCDLDLGDMTLGRGHVTPFGHGQQLCVILSRSNLAARSYGPDTDFGYVYTVTLTLKIWPLVKVDKSMWNIIQIQLRREELWPGHGFSAYAHCDVGDMTFGQGHDTPLGHWHQLCEDKKEEIWLSPMTKAPTPTEMSKGQSKTQTTAQKRSITQRLRADKV